MDFVMDDDVLTLVDSIAAFFDRRGDAKAIADATLTSAPTDRQRWAALCEMGLPALRLAEPDGIGAGLLDATAVAEQIGAVLLPEPAIGTIVLAAEWGSHAAVAEPITAFCGFETVELSAAGQLSGQVQVPDDGVTERVAFLARDGAESAITIAELAALPPPTRRIVVDPTRPTAVVELNGTAPVARLPITGSAANRIRRELAVLTTAELVGGMQMVLTQTVEHLKNREQFGRVVGGFQAIKHKLADMYATTEQARAAVQFAALECANDAASASTSVSSAAHWVTRTAISVCEDAIHLHGAMGYSWEINVHLHLRRALSTRSILRSPKI